MHELILGLPNGYETEMGEGGTSCRRAASARRSGAGRSMAIRSSWCSTSPIRASTMTARRPLTRAIMSVRARGGIAIVIAHRPSVLAAVDQLLVMRGGKQQAFGPKDAVLRETLKAASPPAGVPAAVPPITAPFVPRGGAPAVRARSPHDQARTRSRSHA